MIVFRTLLLFCIVLLGGVFTAAAQETTPEAAVDPMLVETEWQWQAFETADGDTTTVEAPALYSLYLGDDGSLGLRADCNVGNGSYATDGTGELTITLGVMTLAFCAEGSLSEAYLDYLEQVASYSIEGDVLTLTLADDAGVMRFQAAAPIIGVEWQWVEFQSMDGTVLSVDAPENYTLLLSADGAVSVRADCNQGGGTYTLDDSSISFSPIAMTLMACPEGSLAGDYTGYLADVVTYTYEDGELFLSLPMDGGIMRFAPAAPQITNVEWQWVEFQSMDGTVLSVDAPENYTVLFSDDGTAAIKADCNRGSGGYTLEGSELTFGAVALTRAACAPESLSDDYVRHLADVRSYAVVDGNLHLSLQMDGGIMVFAAG